MLEEIRVMSDRKRKSSGFTLVEILIVVVILGILAAIVVPQFTSASESARSSSMSTVLQTLRSQLELYQVQHNGDYPTLAQMWTNLTSTTDVAGATSGSDFGPYLQKAPSNPFSNATTIAADNTGDWQYTAATGAIVAVVSATKISDLALDAADVVAAP
jgi:general secretion pathway protein G